jgi:pimeloyl-ACP methyl ester carboxylesterase
LKNFVVERRLKDIPCITLVSVGGSGILPSELAQRDASRIPNAHLEALEDYRHYCFLDEPEKFEQVVSAILPGN